jgi:hypothetical protein
VNYRERLGPSSCTELFSTVVNDLGKPCTFHFLVN